MGVQPSKELIQIAKTRCRELRLRETQAEKILWKALRNRQFMRLKFRRQHPLFFDHVDNESFYIADFYCQAKKLAIEVDGKIHDCQQKQDELRTAVINSLGIRVIRFRNEEIETGLEAVLKQLRGLLH